MAEKTAYQVAEAASIKEERADDLRSEYLREHGWTYTSSTPGCFWMWCKEWRGKQWSYHHAKDALRAESWMAEYPDGVVGSAGQVNSGESPIPGGKGSE